MSSRSHKLTQWLNRYVYFLLIILSWIAILLILIITGNFPYWYYLTLFPFEYVIADYCVERLLRVFSKPSRRKIANREEVKFIIFGVIVVLAGAISEIFDIVRNISIFSSEIKPAVVFFTIATPITVLWYFRQKSRESTQSENLLLLSTFGRFSETFTNSRQRRIALVVIVISIVACGVFFSMAAYSLFLPQKHSTLILTKSAVSTENFVLYTPVTLAAGTPLPICNITYTVNGSSITSQTPLNISVTVNINPAYSSEQYAVSVSVYSVVILDSIDNTTGKINPQLTLFRVANTTDPEEMLYSTVSNNVVNMSNGGFLTGTLILYIGFRDAPNSSNWFNTFTDYITNQTAIDVQSLNDLQTEKQSNDLLNQTIYDANTLNFLEWLIAGFIALDLGITMLDYREKKKPTEKYVAYNGNFHKRLNTDWKEYREEKANRERADYA